MPYYTVQYICGPNDSLQISHSGTVEAPTFAAALSRYTSWPVVETYDHSSACAQNPGTSIYYMEAWEAILLAEAPTGPPCSTCQKSV